MSKNLSYRDFVSLAPTEVGVEARHNHEQCSAGADTRRRLYVTRTDSTTVTAYCHNCGRGGFWKQLGGRSRDDIRLLYAARDNLYNGEEPEDGSQCAQQSSAVPKGEWSNHATGWVKRYGITDAEIERFKIGYHLPTGRVCLPVYRGRVLIGYQLRDVVGDTDTKYLTEKMGAKTLLFRVRNGKRTCVIVEDMLSAIKVGRQVDTAAMLGSSLNHEIIAKLASEYDEVIIWMDNDNIVIKRKQNEYKSLLDMLCKSARIIRTSRDPKDYTDEEIRRELCPEQ